ncbi:transporter [Robiginitalea aurantiaca]|uniref:Transporter n=1 Tax=Robiginitalea aurantiaca TaxID=3056915 RepID=A0ABT7WBI4_9FLAO|nr:transporter [Robiginitalea aurantiaca]MDM9630273.1 transporter [Robiginitalea aurantiaca]
MKLEIAKPFLLLTIVFLMYQNACSQDLEPRRWTPIPLGTHVLGAGYSYSSGDVFFDPLLEIEDVKVRAHSVVAKFVQPIKIANKLGTVSLLVPFSTADWTGLLSGDPAAVSRTGFADPRIRASLILTGPPAGNAAEIQKFRLENTVYTSFGVSLAVSVPIGEYFEDKLINLGGNRFVFRPQAGMIHTWGEWSFELTGSVFMYTRNPDFFNNSERRQRPTYTLQSHLVKQFKKGAWLSLSAGYGFGGESIINGQAAGDFRSNLLVSASYSFLIAKRQGLKLTYVHTEALENIGADTDNFILAWFISLN